MKSLPQLASRWVKQSCRNVAQLAGRKHLPGSDSKTFPKNLNPPRVEFPLKIDCDFVTKATVAKFGKSFYEPLPTILHRFGAVLLRNLPLETGDEFSGFVSEFGFKPMGYVGGSSVRSVITKRVSTASRDPPEFTIEPHNEMSYLPYWPHVIMLFCDVPPTDGGESGITDVRSILADLDPEIVQKFKRLGVRYYRYLPDASANAYTSWQESLQCNNHAKVEEILKESKQEFEWNADGSLSFWKSLPAFQPHYHTGEELWFNQCHSQNASYFKAHPYFCNLDIPDNRYPFHTYYGDGTEIEPEVLQHVREVSWKHTVGYQMQKSDVLILDNMLVQHSRMAFNGQRRLLISLATM